MEESLIEQKVNKIKHLVQYRDLTEADLRAIAIKQLKEHDTDLDVSSLFTDKKEKKLAKDLLRKYLQDYSIETISDKNAVKDIVYLDIINMRLQEKMNKSKDDDKSIPVNLIETIHKNLDQIIKLKATLGITKREQSVDDYTALQKLKVKFKKWREENQGSRTLICPHEGCGKIILLKIRTKFWEAQGHPFFKDRVLYNKHLFSNLGKTVKIDRVFISKVLESAPDYIDWVVEKHEKKAPNKEEVNKGTEESTEESG